MTLERGTPAAFEQALRYFVSVLPSDEGLDRVSIRMSAAGFGQKKAKEAFAAHEFMSVKF